MSLYVRNLINFLFNVNLNCMGQLVDQALTEVSVKNARVYPLLYVPTWLHFDLEKGKNHFTIGLCVPYNICYIAPTA